MRLGHGPRRAVVILWGWTVILSGVALLPVYTNEGNVMVPFAAAALALGLYGWFLPGVRSARQRSGRARDATTAPAAMDDAAGAVVDLEERRRRRA
jgi:hypothetical protein